MPGLSRIASIDPRLNSAWRRVKRETRKPEWERNQTPGELHRPLGQRSLKYNVGELLLFLILSATFNWLYSTYFYFCFLWSTWCVPRCICPRSSWLCYLSKHPGTGTLSVYHQEYNHDLADENHDWNDPNDLHQLLNECDNDSHSFQAQGKNLDAAQYAADDKTTP